MKPELLKKIKAPPGGWKADSRTLLRLSGPDRVRYLNGQVTQDLRNLEPGQSVRAAVISAKGRLEADCRIGATDQALWIETDGPLRTSLRARLEKFIVADDVTLEDLSDAFRLVYLPGASAVPTEAPAAVLAFASVRFREPGIDLWIPSASPWNPPTSPQKEWEPLRIARGIPLWGIDVDTTTLPPEAGFESDAISPSKGCYIGQEVISRLRSVGHVNRHLCALAASCPSSGPSHEALPWKVHTQEGATIGQITSLAPTGPLLLGLAMIQRTEAIPGNSVLAGGLTWTILRHA